MNMHELPPEIISEINNNEKEIPTPDDIALSNIRATLSRAIYDKGLNPADFSIETKFENIDTKLTSSLHSLKVRILKLDDPSFYYGNTIDEYDSKSEKVLNSLIEDLKNRFGK